MVGEILTVSGGTFLQGCTVEMFKKTKYSRGPRTGVLRRDGTDCKTLSGPLPNRLVSNDSHLS